MKSQLNMAFSKPWLYFILLFVFFLPYLILGENSCIQVLDNMDSNLVWYHSLIKNGALYDSNIKPIDGMVGLQPRSVYPSEWNPVILLTYLFGSWNGYLINFILIHLIAFWGMWSLLQFVKKNTSISKECPDYLIGLTAVFFGLIKFWPHAGLSAAGIPILILGILLVHQNRKSLHGYLLISLYVLYSSLIIGGLFALIGYFIFILFYFVKGNRRIARHHFFVLMGMSLLYVLVEYRLFYATLFLGDYTSHRTEADFKHFAFSFSGMVAEFKNLAFNGQIHAGSFSKWTVVLCGTGIVLLWIRKVNIVSRKYLFGACSLLGIILFLSVLLNTKTVVGLIEKIPVVRMLQMDRFYFLLPCIITLLLFFIFYLLYKQFQFFAMRMILAGIMALLITGNIALDENWNNWIKGSLYGKTNLPTYKSFYAKEQFKEIRQYLSLLDSNYRVASIGIHPAVAVMNDLKSVDGYLSNYDLRSKHNMYAVIVNEIVKDEDLNNYFVKWGHRNYLFNHVLKRDFLQYKDRIDYSPITVHLDYNYEALKSMNCRYIISAIPVDTIVNPGLKAEKIFVSAGSAWTIYLYAVRENLKVQVQPVSIRTINHFNNYILL